MIQVAAGAGPMPASSKSLKVAQLKKAVGFTSDSEVCFRAADIYLNHSDHNFSSSSFPPNKLKACQQQIQ